MEKKFISRLSIVMILLVLYVTSGGYTTYTLAAESHNQTSLFSKTNKSELVQSLGESEFTKSKVIKDPSQLLREDRIIHPPLLPPD